MRAGDVARDRKTKAGANLILIAGLVEPKERPENVLSRVRGNAWPVVVDMHRKESGIPWAFNGDAVAVALGVADKISETALERVRPHRGCGFAIVDDFRRMAVTLGVVL